MEELLVLLAICVIGAVILSPILAIAALVRARRNREHLEQVRGVMQTNLRKLLQRLSHMEDILTDRGILPKAVEPTRVFPAEVAKPPEAKPVVPPTEAKPVVPPTEAKPIMPPPVPPQPVAPKPEAPELTPVGEPPRPHATPARPKAPSRVGSGAVRGVQQAIRRSIRTISGEETPVAGEEDGGISWAKFEEALGKRWLTWAGVLVLFLSAAFFLRYMFVQEWITPARQIRSAVFAGLAMIAAGVHFMRKDWRAFGQGLVGGGLMILYAALFCAYSPAVYAEPVLRSQRLVFALMCLVTALGMALAVWRNAQPISFLAVLGGLLTPLLVSSGENARDALFAYLLLLDLGVLSVALWQRWRALDILAFVGTVCLFVGWYLGFYAYDAAYQAEALVPTLGWLGAFYLVFVALPFVHHLRTRTVITVERFVMAMVNAMLAFTAAYYMLHAIHKPTLSVISLIMSALYLQMSILTRDRIRADRRGFIGFVALAVAFLTIAVPLYFISDGITLAWTAEACALLLLGYIYRERLLRYGAFAVLLLATRRVLMRHWGPAATYDSPWLIMNVRFLVLMCAPLGAAVFAAVHHVYRRRATESDRTLKTICTIGAGMLLLTFLNTELQRWLSMQAGGWELDAAYLKGCSLAMMWAIGAAGFLAGGWRGKSGPVRWAGLAPLVMAIWYAIDLYAIHMDQDFLLCINGRFWAALTVAAMLSAYAWSLPWRRARSLTLAACGYAVLLLFHVEAWQWIVQSAPGWTRPADFVGNRTLAILWALGAGAYFAVGRWRRSRDLAQAGAPALGVAAGFVLYLYLTPLAWGAWLCINTRFLAGALVVAGLTSYGLLTGEGKRRLTGLLGTGYVALVLLHAETWQWLGRSAAGWTWSASYVGNRTLCILWAIGAGAYLAIGRWKRSADTVKAAILPLLVAAGFAVWLYHATPDMRYRLLVNTRFLAGLLVSAALVACVAMLRASARRFEGLVITGYVPLVLLSLEVGQWFAPMVSYGGLPSMYLIKCSVAAIWSLAALGYIAAGRRWKDASIYQGALLPMIVAVIALFTIYGAWLPDASRLFISLHFLAALVISAGPFALTGSLYQDRKVLGENERALRHVMYWVSLGLLFYVLNAESMTWCWQSYRGTRDAGWMANMAQTLVWGAYAAAMLVVGFWRRRRAVRLTALALFAVTAVKLIVVDVVWTQQIYRIIAFFVLGLLMLAAAYAYHRAERLLADTGEDADG